MANKRKPRVHVKRPIAKKSSLELPIKSEIKDILESSVDICEYNDTSLPNNRRSRLSLLENKELLSKFEAIMNSINNIIESLHNEFDFDNKEDNSEQISNFLKILRVLAKEQDNIIKMAEYVKNSILHKNLGTA